MEYLQTLVQILIPVIVVCYAAILLKSGLKTRVLKISALIIFIAGVIVNVWGLYIEGYGGGIVTQVFRGAFMTVKMFFYDNNLFELLNSQKRPFFTDLYYGIYYAAVLTSLSAIFLLFGKRARTWMLLTFRKKPLRHVFVGVNMRSEVISEGISDEDVAFIEFPSESDEDSVSVKKIIRGISDGDEDEKKTIRRSRILLRARRRLVPSQETDNVFATIGLAKLKALVDEKTTFYLLAEDTDRNLDDLMALLGDKDLMKNTIHVCFSREGISRYYKAVLKQTGVHFIYPSSLAVVELMDTPQYHPAYIMEPVFNEAGEAEGAVQGEFNAMVIGFGETGQAVTKFLYEYSSSVLPDGSPLPVNISVYDYRMDSIKGPFVFDNPSIEDSGIIRFLGIGTESSEFWNSLTKNLDSLNYIAIAMGDDAANLDLACTIVMYALKKRKGGLKGLRIAVRKKYSLLYEKKLVRKINEKASTDTIMCFGEYENIFTPELIVSDSRSGINNKATELADRIEKKYMEVSGNECTGTEKETFHEKVRARMELHQMISRANHVASIAAITKGQKKVSEKALENLARMEHLRYSRYLTSHGYSFDPEDDDIFKKNHQICGWEELTEKDRKYHKDIALAQLSLLED